MRPDALGDADADVREAGAEDEVEARRQRSDAAPGSRGGAADNAASGSDGSSGNPNVGRDSGTDAGNDATDDAVEPCGQESALRCSAQGAGNRDTCIDGKWSPTAPCEAGETCTLDANGMAACITVSELCRGSGGQTVCDVQGTLVVCNADESIAMQMACPTARHCEVGKALQTCSLCIPGTEWMCTGVSLEQCAPDGMSFVPLTDCETEALCNAKLGMCTDAVCAPGKPFCDGNSLGMCNEDGTAVQAMNPCKEGTTCDANGGDCNTCEPGTKSCKSDAAVTCDDAGQAYLPTPCESGKHCIGLGQCVECGANEHCAALNMACKVGVCGSGGTCGEINAPNGMRCTASGNRPGVCQSGRCECAPQCDKPCGEDGCGAMCPSTCSGARRYCVEDACAACRSPDDCTAGECSTPTCDDGTCGSEIDVGARCTSVAGGTCDVRGNCTCVSDRCNGGCSGEDNCGAPCPGCTSPQTCNAQRDACEDPEPPPPPPPPPPPTGDGLHQSCTSQDNPDNPNQGSCASGLACVNFSGGSFRCYEAQTGACPTGTASYFGIACLIDCTTTFCPSNAGLQCMDVNGMGWCVAP